MGAAWWVSGALLAAAGADSAPVRIALEPRTDAVTVVLTPFGQASGVGTSGLLAAWSEVIEAHTDLRVRSPEQLGIDVARIVACQSRDRLHCWATSVDGSLGAAARPTGRHLFVVSVRPLSGGGDRVSVTWLDLDRIREVLARSGPLSVEEREDLLFSQAVHTAPRDITDRTPASDVLRAMVAEDLQVRLTEAGHWKRYTAIHLRHDCEQCTLTVDERVVAVLRPGPVMLVDVNPGRHTIALFKAGAPVSGCARELGVSTGGQTQVDLRDCETAPVSGWPRQTVRYAGIGLAATGVALAAVGVDRAARGPEPFCVTRGVDCSDPGLPTFRFPGAGGDEVNPGKPAWLPTGAALIAGGGTFAAGSFLVDDEDWWWPVVAGVLAGGAAYGVTALAQGGD